MLASARRLVAGGFRASHRSLFLVVSALLVTQLLLSAGCNGNGGGGGHAVEEGIAADFTGSGTSPAPDLVYLQSGAADGDLITVEVVIAGPTTSQDLYSFAFDLVIGDPTVAEYESGTAAFGNALTIGGGQDQSLQVVQTDDRVVCGVTKTGGGTGNGVSGSQATVLSLGFRIKKVGTTTLALAGPPPNGEPVALDSNGIVIESVTFDATEAHVSGQ